MKIFELKRMLINDLPWHFLMEVAVRTTVMFLLLMLTLKFTGKRGVKQLSVFETVIIIALGSAAGDPMFYEDVGLLPALLVFLIVLLLYRFVTWLTAKYKPFEHFIEGKAECLIEDGRFMMQSIKKETLAQDEFFSELRLKSVEHLGQVKNAFLETNGDLSVFFFPDDEVEYGLPLLPKAFAMKSELIVEHAIHACSFCGTTLLLEPGTAQCPTCGNKSWVKAIRTKRIT
jgi:uncharacterized membrane protein YcaP (DUF421 family)